MENWSRQIDIYCERLGPGFWAEPVNALTNLAFVLAGLWGLLLLRRTGRQDPMALVLSLIVILIGIGSFLFHTFATRWAALADVLPITVFILVYLGAALGRFCGLSRVWAVAAVVAFLVASRPLAGVLAGMTGGALNGSEGYLPALAALLGIGAWLGLRRHAAAGYLLGAGAVFTLSIGFRSLDRAVCTDFALGTHFLWHLLNAVVLGFLLAALIREGAKKAD